MPPATAAARIAASTRSASKRMAASPTTPMITPEDLPVIPVFASVPPEDLRASRRPPADVRLGVGDYAVHEGDERALFVVLAGRIEVTKVIDGIERVIGAARAGPDLRRGADHLRHAVPGQLPRRRAVARDARLGPRSSTRWPRAHRRC